MPSIKHHHTISLATSTMKSILIVAFAAINLVEAGKNTTLAPTPGVIRPDTQAPITPFPTPGVPESPPPSTGIPETPPPSTAIPETPPPATTPPGTPFPTQGVPETPPPAIPETPPPVVTPVSSFYSASCLPIHV